MNEQTLVVARKIFDAINSGKLVAVRGAIVDAVRVGEDSRLYCYKFDPSGGTSGRFAAIDATNARVSVLTEAETLQTEPATAAGV